MACTALDAATNTRACSRMCSSTGADDGDPVSDDALRTATSGGRIDPGSEFVRRALCGGGGGTFGMGMGLVCADCESKRAVCGPDDDCAAGCEWKLRSRGHGMGRADSDPDGKLRALPADDTADRSRNGTRAGTPHETLDHGDARENCDMLDCARLRVVVVTAGE